MNMPEVEPLLVDCGPHGKRIATVVCQHMICSGQVPVGFVENSDDPNDLQAWCHSCEEKFQLEGEMTDAFREFNGMTVVCVICYAEAKARHSMKGH